MNNSLFYILFTYLIITVIFIGFDIFIWFNGIYQHYKIGRWSKISLWSYKVYNKGLSWLPTVPSIPTTSNTQLILWDIIKGRYKRKSVQAWQTAGLLLGVNEYSTELSKTAIEKTIKHYINNEGMWKVKPKNIDYAILSYSFLKSFKNYNFLKPSMDYMIQLILDHKGKDETIAYSSRKNIRYVDTIGMICPFLILYDKIYQTNIFRELSLRQIDNFIENGILINTWLPVHAYEINNKLPIGLYGWGRGTGWFVMGLIDSYLELPNGKEKDEIKNIIEDIAKYLVQFQREDGGFGIILQDKNKYESSSTAILSYYYARLYEITKKNEYKLVMMKSLLKLMKHTRRNGALDSCQGDTIDTGILSQRFDIMPFVQGMLLRTLAIYKKYCNE